MTDAARTALAVVQAFQALGNERFEADGATFVRNREISDIWDANRVTRITASTVEAGDRLLERVEREYAGFPHRRLQVDFTTPPAFEARLVLEGYPHSDALVMLLQGQLSGTAKPCDIREVTDDAGWEAYAALHELDWREYREKIPGTRSFDENTAAQVMRSRRLKAPPVRHWLAYVDGEPRAYCTSWGGVEGAGQVEDLFTHPDFRHQGLATALIHHCVADCRAQGAGPVVIVAESMDTPKRMYAAMGFRAVATVRDYWKDVEPS